MATNKKKTLIIGYSLWSYGMSYCLDHHLINSLTKPMISGINSETHDLRHQNRSNDSTFLCFIQNIVSFQLI
jgi:hypothetical protein